MEKRLKKHKTYDIYDKIVSKIKFTNSNTNNCYCVYTNLREWNLECQSIM